MIATGGGGGGGGGKSLCIATCDAEMTQFYGKQIGSQKKNFSFHLHIACKSAFSLCMYMCSNSIASLEKVCVIVDRRKPLNLRMAENVHSAVADVTGIVRVMCRC